MKFSVTLFQNVDILLVENIQLLERWDVPRSNLCVSISISKKIPLEGLLLQASKDVYECLGIYFNRNGAIYIPLSKFHFNLMRYCGNLVR